MHNDDDTLPEDEIVNIVQDLKQTIKDQAEKGALSEEDYAVFDKKINRAVMTISADMIGTMGRYAVASQKNLIETPVPEYSIIFTILDQHRTILKYLMMDKDKDKI